MTEVTRADLIHEASLHNKGHVGLNSIQKRVLCISTNIHIETTRA